MVGGGDECGCVDLDRGCGCFVGDEAVIVVGSFGGFGVIAKEGRPGEDTLRGGASVGVIFGVGFFVVGCVNVGGRGGWESRIDVSDVVEKGWERMPEEETIGLKGVGGGQDVIAEGI